MARGKRARIDPDKKTVDTDAGPLPISPLMDYKFIQGRRRARKAGPGVITGQFRRKLSNNPHAEALMTPMRWCKNTNVCLPRYFLQDFELVKHPDPTQTNPWWAPGPGAFMNVKPWKIPTVRDIEKGIDFVQKEIGSIEKEITDMTAGVPAPANANLSEVETPVVETPAVETPAVKTSAVDTPSTDTPAASETTPVAGASGEAEAHEEAQESLEADEHEETGIIGYDTEGRELRRARIVVYALARKSLIDMIGGHKGYQAKMVAQRSGMAILKAGSLGQKVFRRDMGDVILAMLRRLAVDTLIMRTSKRGKLPPHRFIEPVSSWEEAKSIVVGGSVLYIPEEPLGDINSYATLDVEDASYARKMAVHDLRYLLGDEEVERLREGSAMFRNQELLVLKNFRSGSMRALHLLFWRLQGYLAEPQVELTEPRQY